MTGGRPICLSIQSAVVAGTVGQGAAVPALGLWNRVEVWSLPTVLLSNHAAVTGFAGRRLPGTEIAALGRGLLETGALRRADALLTGYLGTEEAAFAVADIVAEWRALRPDGIYLCDPVLGDTEKGLYLPEAVGAVLRDHLLPLADVATPNVFELGWLTGTTPETPEDVAEVAARLRRSGPETVFATSAIVLDRIGIVAVDADDATFAHAPKLDVHLNGTGDFVAAFLLGRLLSDTPPAEAAREAVAVASALAQAATNLGRDDLPVSEIDTEPGPAILEPLCRGRLTTGAAK